MPDGVSRSNWQSVVETVAMVVVAAAVGWMAFARSGPAVDARPSVSPTKRAEPPIPSQPLSLADAQVLGSKTAKVALIVYSDFQCPFCATFARETLPALQAQYVRPGKVLIAFRQFPLPNHQFAIKAAEASECAGRQGKFWPFHDQLFANQKALDLASLSEYARKLGLDTKLFAGCLAGQAVAVVEADKASGTPLGVSGTPAFLVGLVLPDGRVKISQRLTGAQPLNQFQTMLDRLLESSATSGARGQD